MLFKLISDQQAFTCTSRCYQLYNIVFVIVVNIFCYSLIIALYWPLSLITAGVIHEALAFELLLTRCPKSIYALYTEAFLMLKAALH